VNPQKLIETYDELLEASDTISIVRAAFGYHGSWHKLKELVPREVKGLDSLGTWVTMSPKAAKMYAGEEGNVLKVTIPKGRYFRASTDDFHKMFVNIPLVDKHFSKADAKIIKAGFFANDWAWNARWKNNFAPAFGGSGGGRTPDYMKDWRKMLTSQGYKGVIWARSRIDLQREDKPHTVVLLFDHQPLKTALHWQGGERVEPLGESSPAESAALSLMTSMPNSTVDEVAKKVRRAGTLYDPVSRTPVSSKDVLKALEAMRPSKRGGPKITVYHATDRKTADSFLRRGFSPKTKRKFTSANYGPGKGIDQGLYVGATVRDVWSYGPVVLAVKVPKSLLRVPTELSQSGHTDPMKALKSHDGAVVLKSIPASDFSEASA